MTRKQKERMARIGEKIKGGYNWSILFICVKMKLWNLHHNTNNVQIKSFKK